MILHQQLPHPTNGPRLPWLAVHVESLTMALCESQDQLINITPISPIGPISPITNATPTQQAADLIAKDIYLHSPENFVQVLSPLPTSHPALGTLPDYVLLNSLDGTTPAIMHTADPVAIYFADPKTSILAPAAHFRSSVDLTAEGWAYWWQDALEHFQKLTIEFMQATGMPVPEPIADAVKYH